MRCSEVQANWEAYIDGELPAEQAALLRQHIADCAICRVELARWETVETALKTWPVVVEPPYLTAQVMARVRSCPKMPSFHLRWSDFAISLAGASLVYALMLGLRHLHLTGQVYLYSTPMLLRLAMVRLEILLTLQRLGRLGSGLWMLAVMAVASVAALVIILWNRPGVHYKQFIKC